MWSHYADEHRGAILEFQPKIELATELLGALEVEYSKEVPVAVTLEQFLLYITGQGPKPHSPNALVKSAFTKSSDWSYENEWRILNKQRDEDQGSFCIARFIHKNLRRSILDVECRTPTRIISRLLFLIGIRKLVFSDATRTNSIRACRRSGLMFRPIVGENRDGSALS